MMYIIAIGEGKEISIWWIMSGSYQVDLGGPNKAEVE